jgi:hypothetical protein
MDILHTYDISVDIGRQMLRLAEEDLSLWSPGAETRPFSLVMANDYVIPAQCKGVVMGELRRPSECKLVW